MDVFEQKLILAIESSCCCSEPQIKDAPTRHNNNRALRFVQIHGGKGSGKTATLGRLTTEIIRRNDEKMKKGHKKEQVHQLAHLFTKVHSFRSWTNTIADLSGMGCANGWGEQDAEGCVAVVRLTYFDIVNGPTQWKNLLADVAAHQTEEDCANDDEFACETGEHPKEADVSPTTLPPTVFLLDDMLMNAAVLSANQSLHHLQALLDDVIFFNGTDSADASSGDAALISQSVLTGPRHFALVVTTETTELASWWSSRSSYPFPLALELPSLGKTEVAQYVTGVLTERRAQGAPEDDTALQGALDSIVAACSAFTSRKVFYQSMSTFGVLNNEDLENAVAQVLRQLRRAAVGGAGSGGSSSNSSGAEILTSTASEQQQGHHHHQQEQPQRLFGVDDVMERLNILLTTHGEYYSSEKAREHDNNSGSGVESQCPRKKTVVNCMKPTTGILLQGASGTGKSTIARHVCQSHHLKLPTIAVSASRLFSKYLGESEAKLRELFHQARSLRPSILIIDDIDCIAPSRKSAGSEGSSSGGGLNVSTRMLAALLCELDGMEDGSGVLVIGTTSCPSVLDQALLRQGRMESIIDVPLPSKEAIQQMACAFFETWSCQSCAAGATPDALGMVVAESVVSAAEDSGTTGSVVEGTAAFASTLLRHILEHQIDAKMMALEREGDDAPNESNAGDEEDVEFPTTEIVKQVCADVVMRAQTRGKNVAVVEGSVESRKGGSGSGDFFGGKRRWGASSSQA